MDSGNLPPPLPLFLPPSPVMKFNKWQTPYAQFWLLGCWLCIHYLIIHCIFYLKEHHGTLMYFTALLATKLNFHSWFYNIIWQIICFKMPLQCWLCSLKTFTLCECVSCRIKRFNLSKNFLCYTASLIKNKIPKLRYQLFCICYYTLSSLINEIT